MSLPEADQVLSAMLDRGHGLWRAGQIAESLGAFEEALRYAEMVHGNTAIELIEPLTELCGLTLTAACNHQEVGPDPLTFGERALSIAAREGGYTDPRYARLNHFLGSAYLARSRCEDALGHFQVAMHSMQSAGADWFQLGGILEDIVEALLRMGRYAEAATFAERRLQNEEKNAPAISVTRIVAELHLGKALLGAGECSSAVEHIERALALSRARSPERSRFESEALEILEKARGQASHA